MQIILVRTNGRSREDAIHARSLVEKDALVVCLCSYRIARNGACFKLERQSAMALVLIAAAAPRFVERRELIEAMWGDREDGGPDDKIIDRLVSDARFIAPALGLRITTAWGRGHRAEEVQALVAVPA